MSGIYCEAEILQVPSVDWPTIQSAIEAAGEGGTVIVSKGIYLENINFHGKAITVRSANPDDPNTVTETILNGSSPIDPNNASVVTFNSGEGNNSILEGFTITGGTGTWVAISWRFHEIYWNRCGGGIVCYNLSQPTIRKNRIVNNRAGEGGGIYIYGDPVTPYPPVDPAVHIKPVIENNLLENNTAQKTHEFLPPDTVYTFAEHGDGGAIVCFQGVDPTITGNIIRNNDADYYGGGIHLRQWSNGTIEDNIISENNSMLGAGIHLTYNSSPKVRRNLITQNNTNNYAGGGGIYIFYYSDPAIENNRILFNKDRDSAGIGIYWSSQVTIKNNVIAQNYGPGITLNSSSPSTYAEITNNTIAGNYKNINSAGIRCYLNTSVNLFNNIIAEQENGYGIYTSSPESVLELSYNNVWGNPLGNYDPGLGDQTGLNGNISTDPNFSSDGYHLLPLSPCTNAGNPGTPSADILDLDGEPRLFNGRIDIGADEVYFSPADFDTSGQVNIADLKTLSDEWLSDLSPLISDLEENGSVDLDDLAAFSAEWLWTGAWLK